MDNRGKTKTTIEGYVSTSDGQFGRSSRRGSKAKVKEPRE